MKSISKICILLAVLFVTPAFGQGRGPGRRQGDLRTGDPAPDFKLEVMRTHEKIELSSFAGDRPVVLIFGSYT